MSAGDWDLLQRIFPWIQTPPFPAEASSFQWFPFTHDRLDKTPQNRVCECVNLRRKQWNHACVIRACIYTRLRKAWYRWPSFSGSRVARSFINLVCSRSNSFHFSVYDELPLLTPSKPTGLAPLDFVQCFGAASEILLHALWAETYEIEGEDEWQS